MNYGRKKVQDLSYFNNLNHVGLWGHSVLDWRMSKGIEGSCSPVSPAWGIG